MTDPDHRATMQVFADLITRLLLTDLNLSNIVILAAAKDGRCSMGSTKDRAIPWRACSASSTSATQRRNSDFAWRNSRVSLANRWPQLEVERTNAHGIRPVCDALGSADPVRATVHPP